MKVILSQRTFSCHHVNMPSLDRSTLEAALSGLEARRTQLEEHIRKLRAMLRSGARGSQAESVGSEDSETAGAQTGRGRRKRRLSAAGRKRIADAARARWAARRGEGTQSAAAPARKKRGISAAGRRRLAEAMRQRWAAKRTASQAAAKGAGRKSAKAASKRGGAKRRRGRKAAAAPAAATETA